MLSQDEPKAWVYVRAREQFTPGPVVISGTAATIRVTALQLELPMAEIYAGIKVG